MDALRRRAVDVDEAVTLLQAHEDQLDATAEQLRDILAPEELHGLHMEYEANLERALRGIVTAERGCAITRLPHRPPEDEEPFNYWKRGTRISSTRRCACARLWRCCSAGSRVSPPR